MTTGRSGPVISPVITLWTAAMAGEGQSDKTIERRTGTVNQFADWLRDHDTRRDARTATPDDISLFLANPAWSKATRAGYYGDLHAWWCWLLLTGREDIDPTAKVKRPKMPPGAPRPCETRDLMRTLEVTTGDDLAKVKLGCYQALRRAEIARVRGEDFDLEAGVQYVLGKGGVFDAIAIHPSVAEEADSRPREGYWFPGRYEGHRTGRSISERVKAAFLEATGRHVTAHQLRHWCASELIRNGASTREVQVHLRHRSLNSTQIYTRIQLGDVAERLARLPVAA